MKDVLIIKLKILPDRKLYKDLYDSIMDQKEKNLIVLPAWCDCELVNVPDDIEVRIEGLEEDDVKEPLPKSEN
jgi:hypothetical protein